MRVQITLAVILSVLVGVASTGPQRVTEYFPTGCESVDADQAP